MFQTRLAQIIRFGKYLLSYWDKELALLAGRVFSALLSLVTPFLARLTFDYAYGRRDLWVFNVVVLAGAIIWAFSGLLNLIQQYMETYIQQRLDLDIRRIYYAHLQSLSLRFFQSRSTGEQMFRAEADIQSVAGLIVNTIPTAFITALRLVGLLGISFYLHWRLTFLILAVSPLFYFHAHYFGNKQRAIFRRVVAKSQEISAELQEAISHARLIKAFGQEKKETLRYIRRWIERIRLSLQSTRLSIYASSTGSLLNTLVATGLSYYLGYQLIRGTLSLGTLIALSLYLFQLLGVLKSLGGIYANVIVRFVSIDRLLETLDARIEIADAPDAVEWRVTADSNHFAGAIVLRNVTFGYEVSKAVLQDISLEVSPGQTVALVGPSGVGKTTLISLLLRLYDPWSGQILLDGHDVRKLKLGSIRRWIGIAMQDPLLLNGSIRDNICFGNPTASEAQVREAAILADAHAFIAELPRGYDTVIGEEGCNLSAGQQQRIAIARALVKAPRVLILDEAMSSISSASEQRILKSLRDFHGQRTTIIASHRLSTVRDADRIYVLENGRIAEEGSHADLIDKQGAYYRLFADQIERAEALGCVGKAVSAASAEAPVVVDGI